MYTSSPVWMFPITILKDESFHLLSIGTVLAHGPDASALMNSMLFTNTQCIRTATGIPGKEYWQQEADYTIHVSLDPNTKSITGRESIVYTNNSPDTLHYVWMQLDPNYLSKLSARGRMQTAPHMARENASLDVGYVRALELREEYEPNLKISNVKVNGAPTTPIIRDTQMRLSLSKPLESTEQLTIELEWSYTMNDASVIWQDRDTRSSRMNQLIFEVAQFYPRMSIYSDLEGWLTKPYLGTGEVCHGVWRLRCLYYCSKRSYRRFHRCSSKPRSSIEFSTAIETGEGKTAEETNVYRNQSKQNKTESPLQIRRVHGTLRLRMFVTLHGAHPMPSYGMLGVAKSMGKQSLL